MAKAMRVKMTDANGSVYYWTVQSDVRTNLTLGKRPRKEHGWMIVDHEGCKRFVEGNWFELAARFSSVASNYGFTHNLS